MTPIQYKDAAYKSSKGVKKPKSNMLGPQIIQQSDVKTPSVLAYV